MTYRDIQGHDKFCVYCQEPFESSLDLAHHIVEAHKGTYAYHSIKELTGYTLEEASS